MLPTSVEENVKITVICVDCLREDAVGPQMAEFLSNSVHFTNAYAAGPATHPSVPTCLTGKVTGEHGVIETHYKPRVKSWVEDLADIGFQTTCFTANHFTYSIAGMFNEWKMLPWLDPRSKTKKTQDSYEKVWRYISKYDGDLFTYVHLMDVHPPYRLHGLTNEEFGMSVDKFDLVRAINMAAVSRKDLLSDEQWKKIVWLMTKEVGYLDDRIDFPGDIVFFMSDHGEILGEYYRGARWWSHSAKHWSDHQLRIPFGYSIQGEAPRKVWQPFCTRFLGDLIKALLDKGEYPSGGELYWEDYWYNTSHYCVKNPLRPEESLVVGSDGIRWYNGEDVDLANVPGHMVDLLADRMAAHGYRGGLWASEPEVATGEDKEIVEDRLRALGYID